MKQGLIGLVLLLLVGCTAQEQASWAGADVVVGTLPADVCYVGGIPQIISVSVEMEEDSDVAYISSDGKQVVSQKWGRGAIGVTTRETGSLRWELPTPVDCD